MLRNIFIIAGSVFTVLLALLFIHLEMRAHQQQSIVAVFDQARQANIDATHTRTLKNRRSISSFSVREYLAGIQKISTDQCPEKFRLAWLNYIQTLQRAIAPLSGLGAVAEFEVSALGKSGNGAQDAMARLDKINGPEAWNNVETAALDYGVQLVSR